jgi:putative DNA primase/helicase
MRTPGDGAIRVSAMSPTAKPRVVPRRRAQPVIVTTHMDLAAATERALTALVATNDPPQLFLLGDSPVRVEPHPNDGRLITRELTESRVVHHLANTIQWVKIAPDGQQRPGLPSVPVARNILASPSLPFPPLERIVEVPVFGRDGTLCATPGYHAGARLLYQPAPRLEIPAVPASPTDVQITAARRLLCEELTGEFPFTSEAEQAHAIALLLLPFVRDLIDGPTPLSLIEKSTAGTGATLLADVLMRPALGRALPAMTVGNDPDEMRKRLTAALCESPSAVLFDNARRLDSDDLSAVLTTTVWRDRPLGTSRVVQLPVRCAWIATANNPALTFELTRRTVRIRLDAAIERPWLRDGFRHPDLVAWATQNRAELIAAALTLARAWIARGQRPGTHPQLGTYESWSRVLGGILATAHIPGFLSNLTAFYADVVDDETQTSHALIDAWWTRYRSQTVGVQEIWALTQGEPSVDVDLGDKGERSQRTRLGKLLGRMRDRIFNGYRVTAATSLRRAQQWRLCPIATHERVNVENVGNVFPPIHKTTISHVGGSKRSQRSHLGAVDAVNDTRHPPFKGGVGVERLRRSTRAQGTAPKGREPRERQEAAG